MKRAVVEYEGLKLLPEAILCQSWALMTKDEILDSFSPPLMSRSDQMLLQTQILDLFIGKRRGIHPLDFLHDTRKVHFGNVPHPILFADREINLASVLIICPMSNCSPHRRPGGSRALAGDSCPGSCKIPPGSLQNMEVRTYHIMLWSSIDQIKFKPSRQINIDLLFAL